MPYAPVPALTTVTPSNPTAIASASYQMNGLGVAGANAWVITPVSTGRVLIAISGDLVENATAQTATIQLSFGTGAAPANAASVTGTQVGSQPTWVSLTGQLTTPFALHWIVTGLTVGTAVWFDMNTKSSAGTIQITNLNALAIEL